MSEDNKLTINSYSKHIFICVGESCGKGHGLSVYVYLKERLKELKLHQGIARIARSKCSCLGICEGGPMAVVYPDGVWYHHVTNEVIERVLQEHCLQGRIVREFACEGPEFNIS